MSQQPAMERQHIVKGVKTVSLPTHGQRFLTTFQGGRVWTEGPKDMSVTAYHCRPEKQEIKAEVQVTVKTPELQDLITCIVCNKAGDKGWVGCLSGRLSSFSPTTTTDQSWAAHSADVTALCVVEKQSKTLLLSASVDGLLKIWEGSRAVAKVSAHRGAVSAIVHVPFALGGGIAWTGGADKLVRVWDQAGNEASGTGSSRRPTKLKCSSPVKGLAADADCGVVWSCDASNVRAWSADTRACVWRSGRGATRLALCGDFVAALVDHNTHVALFLRQIGSGDDEAPPVALLPVNDKLAHSLVALSPVSLLVGSEKALTVWTLEREGVDVAKEILVEKTSDESVGAIFRADQQLDLERVEPGSAAERCGAARFLGWRLVQVNHANVRTVKDVRQAVRRQARFTLTFEQPDRDVSKPAMRRRSTRRDSVHTAATAAAAAAPPKGITSRENSFGRRIPSTVHSPTPPISSPASPTLPASKKFSTFSARPPSSRSATPVQALANDRSRSADPAVGRRTASTERTPKPRADKRSSSVGRRSGSGAGGRGSPPPPVYLPEPQVVVPPAYQELVGVVRGLAGQPAAEEEQLPELLRQFAAEREAERAELQRELENQRAMFALQLEEKDERVQQLERDGAERLKIDMESSFKKILDPSIDEVLMTMRSALSQNSPATPPAGAAIVGASGAAAATAAAVEGSHDTSSSATGGTPLGLLPSSALDTHLTRCCDALAALTDVHNLEWKEWTPPPVPPPVASADAKASYLLGGLRGLHVELCSQNQANIAHAVDAVLTASTRNLQVTASGSGGGPNGVSPAPTTPHSAVPSTQRATSPARAHSPKAQRLSGTSMSMPMPVMPVLPLRRQGSLSQEQERYLSDRRSAPRETDIRQSSFARGAAADGGVVVGTSTEDARLEQLFDMRNRLQQFLELKPQQLHERAQQAKREAQEKGPQAVHKVVAELDEYHSGERRSYESIMGELENEHGLSSPTQTTLEPLRKGWRDLEGQEAKLLSTVQKLQREYTDTKAVAVAVRHKLEEFRQFLDDTTRELDAVPSEYHSEHLNDSETVKAVHRCIALDAWCRAQRHVACLAHAERQLQCVSDDAERTKVFAVARDVGAAWTALEARLTGGQLPASEIAGHTDFVWESLTLCKAVTNPNVTPELAYKAVEKVLGGLLPTHQQLVVRLSDVDLDDDTLPALETLCDELARYYSTVLEPILEQNGRLASKTDDLAEALLRGLKRDCRLRSHHVPRQAVETRQLEAALAKLVKEEIAPGAASLSLAALDELLDLSLTRGGSVVVLNTFCRLVAFQLLKLNQSRHQPLMDQTPRSSLDALTSFFVSRLGPRQ